MRCDRFSLIDRYITAEIAAPFLLSVGLFSTLGVAIGTLSDLVNKIFEFNLPLHTAVQVFLLKVPEFTAYALPISLLLATLMAYGRLSRDSEITAFRSCGVSIYRLILPALVLSGAITGITFMFNEFVVPTANYQATLMQAAFIPQEELAVPSQDILYPEYEMIPNASEHRLTRLFYAAEFDGTVMKDLTVLFWSEQKLAQIVTARSATWNSAQKSWDFFDGMIYQINPNHSFEKLLPFNKHQISISKAPFDLARQYRDPYEMNIAQAWKYTKLLRLSGDQKKLLMFQVRIQQKIAFPFVCLIFGLLGSVLGLRPQQTGKATSFGLCIAVVFAYYLLGFLIGSVGIVGLLSPFMAAWLPNFFGFGVGGWLLVKTAR